MSESDAAPSAQSRPGEQGPAALLEALQSASDTASPEFLRAAARHTARICDTSRCSLLLWKHHRLWPAVTQAADAPLGGGCQRFAATGPYTLDDMPALQEAIARGVAVIVDHTRHSAGIVREWALRFGSRSTAVMALERGGDLVGAMLIDDVSAVLRPEQLWPAQVMARYLALVIEHTRKAVQSRRRLAQKNRLLEVAVTIGSTLDLEQVLRRIARESAHAAGADTSGIYLVGQDAQALRPLVGYHVPKELLDVLHRRDFALDDFRAIADRLTQERSSIWSDDVPRDSRFDHEIFWTLGMRSIFVTPLRAGAEVLGVLACAWWNRRARFHRQTVSLLEGIAGLAAIAIANARQYSRAETAAIGRERVRVARELHDALNRTVFSAALKLDACLRVVPADAPQVRDKLSEIKRDTGTIMAAIRQLIHELAPQPIAAHSLLDRLRATIDEARALSPISFELTQEGDLGKLDASQQDVVFKVVQEALANVIKHSQASRAEVWIGVDSGEVGFAVTDDGIGAPADVIARLPLLRGHFGLGQGLDRLESIGGQLKFANVAPTGFRLSGAFPLTR